MGCFHELIFAHVAAERQTNIQTNMHAYIHTHFLENNFKKPGGHVPDLKVISQMFVYKHALFITCNAYHFNLSQVKSTCLPFL